jgi:plastocyanin
MLALAVAVWTGWASTSVDDSGPGRALRASVSGRVVVVSNPPPPPTSLSPYARRRYQPPQSPGVPGGTEDAFVYLEPLTGATPAQPDEPVVILQRDRTIIPHVSVAQVGQLVEFPNDDDVYHNLFSLSSGNRFSLGRYAPGVTETNRFGTAGVVRLFCDIHAEMAGVILVVNTPYVARVGADGTYRLSVPAGSYRAIAWHPTAGADSAMLTVPDRPEVTQDFALLGSR